MPGISLVSVDIARGSFKPVTNVSSKVMPKTLLPVGCYDLLPPYAGQVAELSARLLTVFASFGYEQVAPPLLEYSDSLLAGRGAELSAQIFRVMDAHAHKVMGVRTDITLQIARIAANRLAQAPRPLRLCYDGLILRDSPPKDGRLSGDRQLRQAGIELIGSASPQADAEVILVAAEALTRTGITQFSVDLNLPGLVATLLEDEGLPPASLASLHEAIAHKDVASIATFDLRHKQALIRLVQCAGPAEATLAVIDTLALPEEAIAQIAALKAVIAILQANEAAHWSLSVDITEHRGLAYHSGVSFSIFVPGAAFEVGRGGRYAIEETGEEATGFTLYVENLRELLPEPQPQKRVYIADGIASAAAAGLRAQGFVTVLALPDANSESDARRLGCGLMYRNNGIIELRDDQVLR